jgi:type II secretory pathway component PulF
MLFFATRLALLLEMGSSLNRALGAIAAQVHDAGMGRIARAVLADIETGMPLSAALARHPRAFDPVFVSMVRAGESAGILPAMLGRQAELLRRRRQFRTALRGSLTYPAFLIVLSCTVVVFMLTVIFPRFAPLLAGIEDQLPWMTRCLMRAGNGLRQHAIWIGAAMLTAIAAMRLVLHTKNGRSLREQLPVRVPGLGGILRRAYAARLLLSLGTLLASRVPLLEAVQITEGLLPRSLYGRFFAELRASIEGGRGIAPAFAASGLFPPTVQEMIQTGESSAGLDRIMLRLSEFYEDEVQERVRAFLQVLEPVLLVLMGVVVAGISLSLLLPIMRLSGGVH